MTYKHFLKQKLPMCEIKLNQNLTKKANLINCLNRDLSHPLTNRFHHIPQQGKNQDLI